MPAKIATKKRPASASAKTHQPTKAARTSEEKTEQTESSAAEAFMESAAASALAGVRIGHGGPFGASIVRDGVIISCAHNMVMHLKDPTRHAEMNAIKQACEALGTHDLSDCELYTTCEPCPMCWGAVQWSRLRKVYMGVDRKIAAKYGFDDKVFYDEVYAKAGCYGFTRYGLKCHKKAKDAQTGMLEVYDGILKDAAASLFNDPVRNRTLRHRFGTSGGNKLQQAYAAVFESEMDAKRKPILPPKVLSQPHEVFMKRAIAAAERGIRGGTSKEREPFGVVIVKGGAVLVEASNTVLASRDATATAEVNAIRAAASQLSSHNLEGCEMYSTSHPDLMSLGAILWARISRVYCGVTQQLAAQCGFEDGLLHFKDLLEREQGASRPTVVVEGVAVEKCEAVFREWSDRNGVLY